MISSRLRRSLFLLLPISLLLLIIFFWAGYLSFSLFVNALLVLLAIVLMGLTVRLVLERDRRLHDREKKRRGPFVKK